MPRTGANADVRWFDVEPCYVFHPMNAYDDGDTVVLDVVRHPKMFDTDRLGPNEGRRRWTGGPSTSPTARSANRASTTGARSSRGSTRRLVGRRHRYGYAPDASPSDASATDTLLKHDLVGGGTASRSFGAGKELGEFVFHPTSPDAAEDDGVLMGFVYDLPPDRSELALLDAHTLEDVASVQLPHRVPAGFHGNWVPA